ncbi:MAG: MFS transporter, partial [Planctomycetes bacterium]|nr:MFS transporter [Planctomycetota bacterium]
REAIVVLTVLGGLFGVLFIYLFRNTPKDHPWANEAEETLIVEGNPEVSEATHSKLKWSLVLKSRNMKFFFVQQFTSAFADNVYVYWIPLFLLTAKGVDMKEAGWMAAIPLLGGAVGGVIGGILQSHLIIRTGNRRWSRSWIGLIGKLLATVFIFVSLAFNDAVQIVSVFFVVKFFSDWSQPTVWGTITDIAGRNSASVFGCINTVGSIAAVIAGPTMGLTIMMFSDTHSVLEEVTAVAKIERVEERGTFKTVMEPLEYMNVAKGSMTGSIFSGESAIYSFEVSKSGEFSITPLGESVAKPIESRCRLRRDKATVTLEWDESPDDIRLVVTYDYIDYTNGWNTLFIALGVIYLISALCWLFIDCTKTLEDESSQRANPVLD